jgi:16S rRNA (uracil1498-N3)-methyltransferase
MAAGNLRDAGTSRVPQNEAHHLRRRFFVSHFDGLTAVMDGEAAHHLGRVLRAQEGQLYELSDGQKVWLARIDKADRNRVEFALVEELPAHKLAVHVILLLAVVKFDAFEWAIEKATELGVHRIVPLAAARSEKGLLAAAEKRSERWQKILREASQQSRRVDVPNLSPATKPETAFRSITAGVRLILSELPTAEPLRTALAQTARSASAAAMAVGPEGGWTDAELAGARAAQFQEASLGKLILRTETAVTAALASINYALSGES